MNVPCNEARNTAVCHVICIFAALALFGSIYSHYHHGTSAAGIARGMMGIFVICALCVLLVWFEVGKRSHRISGKTLELLWRGRVVKQWDLESIDLKVKGGHIIINGARLYYMKPGGKAFKIISRRLSRIAQQGRAAGRGQTEEE